MMTQLRVAYRIHVVYKTQILIYNVNFMIDQWSNISLKCTTSMEWLLLEQVVFTGGGMCIGCVEPVIAMSVHIPFLVLITFPIPSTISIDTIGIFIAP